MRKLWHDSGYVHALGVQPRNDLPDELAGESVEEQPRPIQPCLGKFGKHNHHCCDGWRRNRPCYGEYQDLFDARPKSCFSFAGFPGYRGGVTGLPVEPFRATTEGIMIHKFK